MSSKVYWFNRYLWRIEIPTESIVRPRPKYRRIRVATTVGGGPVHFGTSGTSPPKVVLSNL